MTPFQLPKRGTRASEPRLPNIGFEPCFPFMQKSGDTIEMYVASGDDFDEGGENGDSVKSLRRSKSVPPPRHAVPQRLDTSTREGGDAAVQQINGQSEAKLVKAELGMTAAELKRTSSELERSRFALKCDTDPSASATPSGD